jgi:hypothetical protein
MFPVSCVFCNIHRKKCVSVVCVCSYLQYSWLCTYVYGVTTSLHRVVLLCAVWSCSLCRCMYVGWGGLVVCFYLVSISCNISKIGLCVSMYVSFICNLFLLILCMWYCSNVFMSFPLLSVFTMSILSVIFPYVCTVFNMWFEYPELPLLFLIAYMVFISFMECSTCLSYVFYCAVQAFHLVYATFFHIYLFVWGGFTMFCIVFRVLNAIFISVSIYLS